MSDASEWAEVVNAKFERVRESAAEVADLVKAWRQRNNPHTITMKQDESSGEVLLHVAINDWPTVQIAVLMGEFVHNLRSILDFTVVQLWAAGGSGLPAQDGMFPCIRSDSEWKRRAVREPRSTCETCGLPNPRPGMVYGIAPAAQAIIKQRQPYMSGMETNSCHPLTQLVEMSNADKHNGIFNGIELSPIDPIKLVHPSHPEPFYHSPRISKTNTQVLPSSVPLETAKMFVNYDLFLEPRISFVSDRDTEREMVHRIFLAQSIHQLSEWVSETILDLRPFFGAENLVLGYPYDLHWPPTSEEE